MQLSTAQSWRSVETFLDHHASTYANYLYDKMFWRELFKIARTEQFTFSQPYPKVIAELKQLRWKRRRRSALSWWYSSLEQRYGKELGSWLQSQVDLMCNELADPCIDNIRIAKPGVQREIKQYKRAIKNGCCGRHDRKVTHPVHGVFFIGCNYGH